MNFVLLLLFICPFQFRPGEEIIIRLGEMHLDGLKGSVFLGGLGSNGLGNRTNRFVPHLLAHAMAN
jgi:hypothetical protein